MPPRHAYWTILVDDQPTAFRASAQDDLMPTFKRLKLKHASAKMMWWQNGKLWDSRLDAQEAMRARGEMGRRGDFRQRQQERPDGKLEWRPKDPKFAADGRESRRSPRREGGLEWKPKSVTPAEAEGRIRRSPKREGGDKLEWRPKGSPSEARATRPSSPRRPRATTKPGERRDKTWRPGGVHRDPRQKYKDAKKAKWTRFKQTIRKRWDSKQTRKKKDDE